MDKRELLYVSDCNINDRNGDTLKIPDGNEILSFHGYEEEGRYCIAVTIHKLKKNGEHTSAYGSKSNVPISVNGAYRRVPKDQLYAIVKDCQDGGDFPTDVQEEDIIRVMELYLQCSQNENLALAFITGKERARQHFLYFASEIAKPVDAIKPKTIVEQTLNSDAWWRDEELADLDELIA